MVGRGRKEGSRREENRAGEGLGAGDTHTPAGKKDREMGLRYTCPDSLG